MSHLTIHVLINDSLWKYNLIKFYVRMNLQHDATFMFNSNYFNKLQMRYMA